MVLCKTVFSMYFQERELTIMKWVFEYKTINLHKFKGRKSPFRLHLFRGWFIFQVAAIFTQSGWTYRLLNLLVENTAGSSVVCWFHVLGHYTYNKDVLSIDDGTTSGRNWLWQDGEGMRRGREIALIPKFPLSSPRSAIIASLHNLPIQFSQTIRLWTRSQKRFRPSTPPSPQGNSSCSGWSLQNFMKNTTNCQRWEDGSTYKV